jgi:EAL domain-containing protein (putative c-di-GMP-specific phosphodiesterase class I)
MYVHALRADGCDLVHGYLISQPHPIRQFDGFVLSVIDGDKTLERAA